MSIFDFFKTGKEPLLRYPDSILGELVWNDSEESWEGFYNGFNFSLAYDKNEKPNSELVCYAQRILNNKNWLTQTFQKAKSDYLLEYPNFKNEIEGLFIGHIHFYRSKNANRILADFNSNNDGHLWRIEYFEDECEGIDFDS